MIAFTTMAIFLISFVVALEPSTSISVNAHQVAATDVDSYVPSTSNAHGKASSSKERCLTQWISKDGKYWEKRDLYQLDKTGKVRVIDGENCKVNESLAQARWGWSKDYLRPLYQRYTPMWPSLLWR